MPPFRRRRLTSAMLAFGPAALAAGGASAQSQAQAQAYPSRPIRAIVPFPPGSTTDAIARFVGERIGRSLGQPVVVENIAGANGVIGARTAARAPADGHTVIFAANSTHAANVHLVKDLGYDPVRDFAPVALTNTNALVLFVRPDFPARDLREFLAHARANPGRLNYGTGNAGSLAAAQLLKTMGGIEAEQVSYRGTPAAVADLLGGRLDFMVVDLGPTTEHLRAGTLRALAVTTAHRIENLPDVPTMAEAGLPGYDYASWNAVYVPARTPEAIVARLNRAVVDVVDSPEGRRFFVELGMMPQSSTPQGLAEFTLREIEKWRQITESAGLRPQ